MDSLAGGAVIILSGIVILFKKETWLIEPVGPDDKTATKTSELAGVQRIILSQLVLIVSSMIVVWDTAAKLKAKVGLPVLNQIASWAILGKSCALKFEDRMLKGF